MEHNRRNGAFSGTECVRARITNARATESPFVCSASATKRSRSGTDTSALAPARAASRTSFFGHRIGAAVSFVRSFYNINTEGATHARVVSGLKRAHLHSDYRFPDYLPSRAVEHCRSRSARSSGVPPSCRAQRHSWLQQKRKPRSKSSSSGSKRTFRE